jgi:hypothetical protein
MRYEPEIKFASFKRDSVPEVILDKSYSFLYLKITKGKAFYRLFGIGIREKGLLFCKVERKRAFMKYPD